MSYGGHALDMIKRSQENRKLLNLRRERAKEARKRNIKGNSTSTDYSHITAEEFEQILMEQKKHEEEKNRSSTRMMLMALALIAVVLLIIWGVFELVV